MILKDLLKIKGSSVVSAEPETKILEAAKLMVENKVGAVLIVHEGVPAGIFTERDLLRLVARRYKDIASLPLKEVMSKNLIIGYMRDKVENARATMIEKKLRHLPVMGDDKKIAGIISIGDTVKASLEDVRAEIHYLEDYILGKY